MLDRAFTAIKKDRWSFSRISWDYFVEREKKKDFLNACLKDCAHKFKGFMINNSGFA